MSDPQLEFYESSFIELRERLIRVLGAPTVNRLVDRAVAEISLVHPGISSLRCEDERIVLDGVRGAFAAAEEAEVRAAFTALNGVLLLLVARLLGREIAERLTEGISIAEYLRVGAVHG